MWPEFTNFSYVWHKLVEVSFKNNCDGVSYVNNLNCQQIASTQYSIHFIIEATFFLQPLTSLNFPKKNWNRA